MTAPTEAEIREAILTELGDDHINNDDDFGLYRAFRPIVDSDEARSREASGWDPDFNPQDDHHPFTLWADMTADEAAELQSAIAAVEKRVAREATTALVEAVVAATAAFAAAHPDIPRGRWVARETVSA